MIRFKCPDCGKGITVGDDAAGKTGKCPGCGQTIHVPQAKQMTDDDVVAMLGEGPKQQPEEVPVASPATLPWSHAPVVPVRPPGSSSHSPVGLKERTDSKLALASLITGVLGVCCFRCFPLGIAGIILGLLAINEINNPANAKKGKGIAVAGISLGGMGLIVMLIAMVVPRDTAMQPGSRAMRNSTDTAEEEPSREPGKGETGYIDVKGETTVWVSIDEGALDELNAFSRARNEDAIKQMMHQGRVLVCSKGTKVSVVDPGLLSSTIRIMEGKHSGKTGIVPNEFLHKQ